MPKELLLGYFQCKSEIFHISCFIALFFLAVLVYQGPWLLCIVVYGKCLGSSIYGKALENTIQVTLERTMSKFNKVNKNGKVPVLVRVVMILNKVKEEGVKVIRKETFEKLFCREKAQQAFSSIMFYKLLDKSLRCKRDIYQSDGFIFILALSKF